MLQELGDAYPIMLGGQQLGRYTRVTTSKEDLMDFALGQAIAVTEGLQQTSAELLVAPGVDVGLMVAVAICVDQRLTEQKQVVQLLTGGGS